MKITVECRQEVANDLNYSEVEARNRYIYNLAGNFELKMLFDFGSVEPVEQEVVLVLFYEKDGQIKWAFKNSQSLTEDIKETVRKKLSGS